MQEIYEKLEFNKFKEQIAHPCGYELSKKKCLEQEIYENLEDAKFNLDLTTELRNILSNSLNIPHLNVKNIFYIIDILKKYQTLNEEELFDVAEILKSSRLMKNFVQNYEEAELPNLSSICENLFSSKDLEDKIYKTFDSDLRVKDNATPTLKSLRQKERSLEENLKHTVVKLMSDKKFSEYLQDNIHTKRNDRIVFQIKAEAQNKVEGIVHDVSQTSQTYFIEPKEIVEIDNQLNELQAEIKIEIEKILKELTQELYPVVNDIETSLNILTDIDFTLAKAKYSLKNDCAVPKFSDKKEIILKSFKNPILMEVLDKVIENDLTIDDYKTLIISGSNTGGKTVILKTVGLYVIMALSGFHLPCYEATIYPYSKIYADIGDNQNIVQSLSTFSSHMKNIIEIINNSDKNSLILIDEINSGTDPNEGASLAQAILEYLNKKNTTTIVTTHYSELKSLAYIKEDKSFRNASVEFDTNNLRPTFKLLMDIPGASNAITIAKNLGLDDEIVEYAQKIHYTQKDTTAEVLKELQNTQQVLSKNAQEAIEKMIQANELKNQYDEKLNKIRKDKKKDLGFFKKKLETEVKSAKDEIKQIIKELQKEKSEKLARRSFSRVATIENRIKKQFAEDEMMLSDKYSVIDWDNLELGQKAMIKDLNQQVEIMSYPDKNGNVKIKMGLIETTINYKKLVKYDKNLQVKLPKKYNVNSTNFDFQRHEMSNMLDIRGFHCEEAIDEVEAYLDKASLCGLSPVYIIHGHGTGALKQVVRDYLETSPYVAKYRTGTHTEGGDGISVIDVN